MSVMRVQLLSVATLIITQWAPEQNDMVARIKFLHELTNIDFHSLRPTWLQSLLSNQSASSRKQHWVFNMAPFLGWSASYLVVDWLYWTASIVEVAALFSLLEWTCSGYWYAFPTCTASSKTTIYRLQNALDTIIIPYSIASDQGIHFIGKEVWQWALTH